MNTPPDLVALSVAHASYDNLLVRLTRLKKKGGQNDRPEYGHGTCHGLGGYFDSHGDLFPSNY